MLKKFDFAFIRNLFTASLIILFFSIYPLFIYASKNQIISFIYGYAISLANVLVGFGLIETAMTKDIKKFMVIIFSGMIIRIFSSAAFLVLLLSLTIADARGLIASFFLFYVVFTVLEIKFIHGKKPNSEVKLVT
jgi:hypothetical protein